MVYQLEDRKSSLSPMQRIALAETMHLMRRHKGTVIRIADHGCVIVLFDGFMHAESIHDSYLTAE